ncbi:MAG TPA: hypothetical protein VGE72_00385 [Azospirillum sp.]
MSERLFLYIDILGFKDLVAKGFDIMSIYEKIDRLPAHSDEGFSCIVFSDTIVVYGDGYWLRHQNQGIMWLAEFAQHLFYNLISLDVHIRAYLTSGDFEHHKLKNLEAYYGEALVKCYEREKDIKSTGLFIDSKLLPYCDIFKTTEYDEHSHYVHVMQHLDEISWRHGMYPIPGICVSSTGAEWWLAYLLTYLRNTHKHANDISLPEATRLKHRNAWNMISQHHPGLTQTLEETDFNFREIVDIDWAEPLRRIGTEEGAWG